MNKTDWKIQYQAARILNSAWASRGDMRANISINEPARSIVHEVSERYKRAQHKSIIYAIDWNYRQAMRSHYAEQPKCRFIIKQLLKYPRL